MGLFDSFHMKIGANCPACNEILKYKYDKEYTEWQSKEMWWLMQHYYEGNKMKIEMTNNLKFIAKGNEKIKVHRGCINCGAFLGAKIIIKDGIPEKIIKIKKLPIY